jgi:hypothetical protein
MPVLKRYLPLLALLLSLPVAGQEVDPADPPKTEPAQVVLANPNVRFGMPAPTVAALAEASRGLQYTRETEAGLEPFRWEDGGKLTKKRLLELAGIDPGTAVDEESLEDFLHAVPPEDKEAFDRLAKVINEKLTGVKVYKVGGEAEKQCFVVGKTKEDQWAGLRTTVVET